MRRRLQIVRTEQSQGDDIQNLLTILDTIRAIPYASTASSEKEREIAFFKFVECSALDANAGRPDLAAAQKEMVSQGWALLCFEVLCAEELHDLHLTCLRLLLAMTGGGNTDVQDAIYHQVIETPVEQLGFACRRLLRAAITDLKVSRKILAAQLKGSRVPSGVAEEQSGFAVETLSVIANMCKGNHAGLQDYFRSQQGHVETYDIISDVVNFTNQLERDMMNEIVENEASNAPLKPKGKAAAETAGAAPIPTQIKETSVREAAQAAFDVLRSLASGPNLQNQQAIANSDILSVVNRLLAYSEYTCIADIDEGGPTLSTTKGHCNAQISSLLLSLVEGIPDEVVVLRLISAIEWSRVASHLQVLKNMMQSGTLDLQAAGRPRRRKKKGRGSLRPSIHLPVNLHLPHLHLGSSKAAESEDETSQSVPTYVCDTRTGNCAEWLSTEGFRWYTICESLRIAGRQLQEVGGSGGKNARILETMSVVFRDTDTVNFYSERIGQVEVVREAQLERLFFLLPANYR
jgi:hypothetical protein